MQSRHILISGASFAGLATAFWMKRAGYDVTIVETSSGLREGGTPVNIKGETIGILDRMGLLDQVVANRIVLNSMELWGPEGLVHRADIQLEGGHDGGEIEHEIERDRLTELLFSLVENDVDIIFDDSVVRLLEHPDGIEVQFRRAPQRAFDLVFGCDGIHSNVRALWFGGEAAYAHFLKTYGSVTIVPHLLIEQGTIAVYQDRGRSLVLSAYRGKTDIITVFSSDDRIHYDRRDSASQIAIVRDHFRGAGWRVSELMGEIQRGPDFYFSDLSQIRMPAWSKGRVALVGDAAYCASAAAGMGGSLALNGADALGQAFVKHGDDHVAAFASYNKAFSPFVRQVQAHACSFCQAIAAGQSF